MHRSTDPLDARVTVVEATGAGLTAVDDVRRLGHLNEVLERNALNS